MHKLLPLSSTVALALLFCFPSPVQRPAWPLILQNLRHPHRTAPCPALAAIAGQGMMSQEAYDDERHTRYWMDQVFPVMLVIRTSKGEVHWMEVRDWLKRASGKGEKPVKQIVSEGKRFDVMSVRGWRDKVLGRSLQQ